MDQSKEMVHLFRSHSPQEMMWLVTRTIPIFTWPFDRAEDCQAIPSEISSIRETFQNNFIQAHELGYVGQAIEKWKFCWLRHQLEVYISPYFSPMNTLYSTSLLFWHHNLVMNTLWNNYSSSYYSCSSQPSVDNDLMKRRAERFGLASSSITSTPTSSPSPSLSTEELEEKKKARAQRFGLNTSSALNTSSGTVKIAPSSSTPSEVLTKRAERFRIVI